MRGVKEEAKALMSPRLKLGIHLVLGQAPKRYASRFPSSSLGGNGAVRVFLERIEITKTVKNSGGVNN